MAVEQRLRWRCCFRALIINILLLVEGIHGIRHGPLSSYLRGMFMVGPDLELNQMVVGNDSGTAFVYLGGLSRLFQLDLDLSLQREESTLPNDTVLCENPECSFETKILEIAPSPVGKLIQCGGPEGRCELRNLMDISRELGYNNISVVNDGRSVGVVAITPFDPPDQEIFVVATSIDSNSPGPVNLPISQRILQDNIFQMLFERNRAITGISSNVDYIQALSWTRNSAPDYNFFIVHSDSDSRRLGRLCVENLQYELNSYSEIILSCQLYTILQSAYIDSNDILYGVFTNGTHSALCSYAMDDIQEKFIDAECGCVISDDVTCNGAAISYLAANAICFPSPSSNETRESISEQQQCGDDSLPLLFSYAQGTIPIEGNLLEEALPGVDSSIVTLEKENISVALVTTSSVLNTTLNKIHVMSDNTGRLYERVSLNTTGSVLTDVHIDQMKEELFILTNYEVMKVAAVNCSQYYTFRMCIDLQNSGGDPFCGWCTEEHTCSRLTECTNNGSEWRQYHKICTSQDNEVTCLDISDPGDGIDCTVPTLSTHLLTSSIECLSGSSVSFGTVCSFFCDPGYNLTGAEDTITCRIYTSEFVLPTCQDVTPPSITCAPNITLPTLPGRNYSTVTIPQPNVTDEVGTTEFTNATSEADLIIGLHEIIFQATDDAGNAAFCSLFVLVEGNTS